MNEPMIPPADVAERLVIEAARRCRPPFPEGDALDKVSNAA